MRSFFDCLAVSQISNIADIDGNKLTIDFDKAGQNRVLDGFVERVG